MFWWALPGFPEDRALEVTARTVARWCQSFRAEMLAPRKECKGDTKREGSLPENPDDKEAFVQELISWIKRCSVVSTFRLLMDDSPILETEQPKFAYFDEIDSWFLRLDDREFLELRDAWRKAGLPEDLFAPEDDFFCVPWPGTGLLARLWRLLGVQKCYSPKEAEAEGIEKPA